MELAQVRINVNEATVRKYQEQIESTLAEQTQINIGGGSSEGRFERLTQQFEFLQGQQSELNAQVAADYQLRQKVMESLALEVAEVRGALLPLQVDALALIRKELEFNSRFRKAEYLAIKEESLKAAKAFVQTVTDEVHKAAESEGKQKSS